MVDASWQMISVVGHLDLPKLYAPLPACLTDLDAAGSDSFDVVAFTHADDDHIHLASEFFHLEHAEKYQGQGRIKIVDLWVPAAVILEEGLEDDARIIQAEARHRLKLGRGVRVFSRPERLGDWLKAQGISLGSRQHLITDAGGLVPGFLKGPDGVEFFVHSPFAAHSDGKTIDRNESCLVLHATFQYGVRDTKLFLGADTTHDILTEIVQKTKRHKNVERLLWDIFKLPHHCSYTTLGPEQGKEKTDPVPDVKWLFEQGSNGAVIVSTSWPIPGQDTEDNQPPHRQAARYYRDLMSEKQGDFIVTMEHPTKTSPDKLIITIDTDGARVKKQSTIGPAIITSRPSPRAG